MKKDRDAALDLNRLSREAPVLIVRHESEEFFLNTLAKTDDAKEGIFAFLEKRAPVWTNR